MMKCRRVQPQLLDFSFGRLDSAAARAVAEHLEHCTDCRCVLKREQRIAAALGEVRAIVPGVDAWPAVEAAMRAGGARERRRRIWRRPIVWMGGLAAAAAVIVGLAAPASRPAPAVEPDLLRALSPATAAGLGPERPNDPLLKMQARLGRLLDRVADEGS